MTRRRGSRKPPVLLRVLELMHPDSTIRRARLTEIDEMPYKQYLLTEEWAQFREGILERDGRKCVACESEERLEVHHETYEHLKREHPDDVFTLCDGCHEARHANGPRVPGKYTRQIPANLPRSVIRARRR